MYDVKAVLLSLFILFPFSVFANISSDYVEFGTYLRSGVGANSRGGDQVCFNNPGAAGNEFRIGNECTTYGEFSMTTYLKRPDPKSPLYGYAQIRLAYGPPGNTNYEGANGTNPIAIRESYAQVGGIGKQKLSFWVGNRFYREQEMFMSDFFYFADTSGNGGGVGEIPFLFKSKAHFAILRETKTQTQTTDNGSLALTLFDMRIKGIDLHKNHKLNLWLGHGLSSAGVDTTSMAEYDDGDGQVYGAILLSNLNGGFNHFSVIYGNGLLDQFNLYGDLTVIKGSSAALNQKRSNRLRFVEHLTLDVNDKFSFHLGSTLELRDSGADQLNKEVWYNFGVHPVYFVSENYQLTGQVGTSVVDAEGSGPRRMTRVTFAPQVSLHKGIWSRPVLRFIFSKTFWSRSNRGRIGGTTYANETSGTNIALQMETWF